MRNDSANAAHLRAQAADAFRQLGLRVTHPGKPLCTCILGKFGGIDIEDPMCKGTDMH